MKKLLKIVAAVVGVLLVLLIVTPLLLKNKIGDIVKREANAMLTAQVDFDRLGISLIRHFPHASVELKGLTVVGVEEFAGDTLLAADRISVVVKLTSLFGDSGLEVTRVLVDRPLLAAWKRADGATNWDIVRSSGEEEPETADTTASSSSFRVQLKDLRIEEARLSYADDSAKTYCTVNDLSLKLKGDFSADVSDLDLDLGIGNLRLASGGVTFVRQAEVAVKAVVEADFSTQKFVFRDNVFRLNAIQMGLDGWVQLLDDAVDMDLRVNSSKVEFRDLLSLIPAFYMKDFQDLTASGELTLEAWAKGRMEGSSLPAFGVQADVKNGSFKYAALPKSVDAIRIAAAVNSPGGVADRMVIDLNELSFALVGNPFRVSFHATHPMSDMNFRAEAEGKLDLGAVKEVYPLGDSVALEGVVTADLRAAGRLSDIEKERYEQIDAEGKLTVEQVTFLTPGLPKVQLAKASATITPSALELSELNAAVGRSDLAASGCLTGYLSWFLKGDPLAGSLSVRSGLIDLNEWMSDAPTEEEVEGLPADTASGPFIVPKNLDLALTVDLKKVLFQEMVLSDIAGRMSVSGGALRLNGLSMGALGGKLNASGSYSTAVDPSRPKVDFALRFTDASFAQTFKELDVVRKMVPIFEKTGGNYSMQLDLQTDLDANMSPDLMSLTAQGEISSSNIRIQNIKAFEALATALNDDRLRNIEAKDVRIPFSITQGRITTQPFTLSVAGTKIDLSGTTGLDQSIDYTACVTLPAGTAGGYLQEVDVKITGSFSSPKISLDAKKAATQAVQKVVDDAVGKLTGGKTLDEELDSQIEKLRAEAKAAGDKLVEAARTEADKLVEKAGNPLAKIAARKSADLLVEKAEEQAAKLVAEAEKKIEALRAEKSGE